MFKDILKNLKIAVRNDLKTGPLARTPSVIGNILMGEPAFANTKWGKPKVYEQQPFKLANGQTWVPPKIREQQNTNILRKVQNYAPSTLNLSTLDRSGLSGYTVPRKPVRQAVAGTSTRIPSPTPTSIPNPTITPPPDQAAIPYAEIINNSSKRNNIPDHILYNLIKRESNFNPNAQSGAGAQGIAQIVPRWHPNVDPFNPTDAINYAGKYLRQNFDNFGSWENALAAYNAGGPAVGQYGGIPPYPETQNYVRTIMDWVNRDKKRYKKK